MRGRKRKIVDNDSPILDILEPASENPDAGSAEIVQIDVTDLLEAIKTVSALDGIENIRQGVRDILDHLGNLSLEMSSNLPAEASYIIKELNQVIESQTPVRARYYLMRLVKGLTKVRTNRFNDINLNRWKEYPDILTDSLWILDKRDRSGAHTAGYWGNFVPQIPNQLIRRFTKPGDWVLDTFAGSGTTLIESQRLGRNCLGIDLLESIATSAAQSVSQEPNPYSTKCDIVVGDCTSLDIRKELNNRGAEKVQLVIMHPPYYDIIKFSEDPRDMSNAASVDAFLELMGKAVDNVKVLLEPGRYLGLVIGDKFSKGEWIPLGFLTSQVITSRGFLMKSIIVKNFDETLGKRSQKELWKYRSLAGGYYVFKHEYIFLFTKNP